MTTTPTVSTSVPTKPFDEARDYISNYTNLTYIGKPGAVDSVDPNLPLVFYVHPFCGMRAPDEPDVTEQVKERELDFMKSLQQNPLTIVYVLGGDFFNAHVAKTLSERVRQKSFFALSIDYAGRSTYDLGNMLVGLDDNHAQIRGLLALSERKPEVYATGSYLDRCHMESYRDLRFMFSKTIVPLGSVFARRDDKPLPKPDSQPGITFGNLTDYWMYDWHFDEFPKSKYEISPLTLEEHLKVVSKQ